MTWGSCILPEQLCGSLRLLAEAAAFNSKIVFWVDWGQSLMCVFGSLMFSPFAVRRALKHLPINELLVCNWPVQLNYSLPFFCISPAGYMISGSDECFIAYKQFFSLILYYLTEDLVFDDRGGTEGSSRAIALQRCWLSLLKIFFKTQTNKQNPNNQPNNLQNPNKQAKLPKLLVATQTWGLAWNYGRCGHPRAHVEALKLKSPSTAGR